MPAPLPQNREVSEHALHVGGHRFAVAAGIGAKHQVVLDREAGEGAAPVGHVRDAAPHDFLGRLAVDRRAVEDDFAGHLDHAAHRAQRRGLAGAVGAEDGRDAAPADREVEAEQHLGRSVAAFQSGDFE